MTCNAKDLSFSALSVCSAKAGTIQQIMFDYPINGFRADDSCGVSKITEGTYEFKPAVGWCRASFRSGKKFHDVIINGYDEVLIREKH